MFRKSKLGFLASPDRISVTKYCIILNVCNAEQEIIKSCKSILGC